MNKLVKKDLVRGLPKSRFKYHNVCDACVRGNQVRSSFKPKKKIQVKMSHNVVSIRSDHGIEFDNAKFDKFCAENGSQHCLLFDKQVHDQEVLEKFDAKYDEGILLGYSSQSKTYKVYNKRTQCVEENIHIIFDESHNLCGRDSHDKNDQDREQSKVPGEVIDMANGKADLMSQVKESNEEDTAEPPANQKNLVPSVQQLKQKTELLMPCKELLMLSKEGFKLDQRQEAHLPSQLSFSQIEPKNIKEVLKDADWIIAMQDELHQFERNSVWNLVPRPSDRTIIGTRWVFKNKLDEFGNTTRNKARLVVQGYNQEEGIDYDETFAPIARMEVIRILIAFASHMEFKLFQKDVKSAFMNGYLKEEVFVKQPPGFECHEHPEHVFMLDKALYGLKKDPHAWYERLFRFLLENGFTREKINNTLFLKKRGRNLLIVQVYVDDIIFWCNK
ncbi:uncharacterized protein LOC142164102 [Nicotiana tabacum]|uniref:Uncharacterized protein LOC142164102 n=1 Tax=Nicotiana tabacum TaxID=4097 RepID=A0AC58RXI4_TOBAC